jgi:hypothetical protein
MKASLNRHVVSPQPRTRLPEGNEFLVQKTDESPVGVEDAGDDVSGGFEEVDDWHGPDDTPGWSLIELYRQGQIRFEVGWRFRVPEVEPRNRIAIVERFDRKAPTRTGVILIGSPPDVFSVEGADHDKKQPVLVNVAELVDSPQEIVGDWVSLVRLYRVDRLEDVSATDAGVDVGNPQVAFLIRPRMLDGELRLAGGLPFIEDHELLGEMIERRPQVEQSIPNDGTPGRVNLWNFDDIEDRLGGMTLGITHDLVSTDIEDWAKYLIEFQYVRVRPRQLYSQTVKRIGHTVNLPPGLHLS